MKVHELPAGSKFILAEHIKDKSLNPIPVFLKLDGGTVVNINTGIHVPLSEAEAILLKL